MNFQEVILLHLSRSPSSGDYDIETKECTIENSLSLLENEFSNFGDLIYGKKILDFGCGIGYQSIALVSA